VQLFVRADFTIRETRVPPGRLNEENSLAEDVCRTLATAPPADDPASEATNALVKEVLARHPDITSNHLVSIFTPTPQQRAHAEHICHIHVHDAAPPVPLVADMLDMCMGTLSPDEADGQARPGCACPRCVAVLRLRLHALIAPHV